MKVVIFGLTITSSWGNGHATLWRGLVHAMVRRGWHVVFFERDVPYYARARDLLAIDGAEIVLFDDWEAIEPVAQRHLADADVAMVTSYCPDGIAAADLVLAASRPLKLFYDLDTPATLSALQRGESLSYIGPRGLEDFDLVLSYTGGEALAALRDRLGARMARPLFGHVDPDVHRPAEPRADYRAALSYIGTYAADRQEALVELFLRPARERPQERFVIAGAQYPQDFPWTDNIFFVYHLPPGEHPAFYSSSRLTLNITRQAMARMGWCPSGRLFEAAACGVPILSDAWAGLDAFFRPGQEILVAARAEDVVSALDTDDAALRRMAAAARERVLAEHTSARRVDELEALLEEARGPSRAAPMLQTEEN
ncbi:spore maturation protein CgeB [Chelatococcus caeni]|uniref:Spore maturation protein CgeB n=1 Tax=Chelatococcus caeni TaxID=1348468 RepID=A0A840BXQ2_9HYPH|nr:glycosyltransferase [Chelatococcus caeni]MBB4016482.1 spore maturation protein CgeB [Chelatococcus caeni]